MAAVITPQTSRRPGAAPPRPQPRRASRAAASDAALRRQHQVLPAPALSPWLAWCSSASRLGSRSPWSAGSGGGEASTGAPAAVASPLRRRTRRHLVGRRLGLPRSTATSATWSIGSPSSTAPPARRRSGDRDPHPTSRPGAGHVRVVAALARKQQSASSQSRVELQRSHRRTVAMSDAGARARGRDRARSSRTTRRRGRPSCEPPSNVGPAFAQHGPGADAGAARRSRRGRPPGGPGRRPRRRPLRGGARRSGSAVATVRINGRASGVAEERAGPVSRSSDEVMIAMRARSGMPAAVAALGVAGSWRGGP